MDIFNKYYNPKGKIKSTEFRFPYPENSFDFAFATSVFTHMLPAEIANYLQEIHRVLKVGGTALVTAFIWNDEVAEHVAAGKSTIAFTTHGDLIVKDKHIPEDAIAIRQSDLNDYLSAAGLTLDGPIRWGSWCGRPEEHSYQDLLHLKKL